MPSEEFISLNRQVNKLSDQLSLDNTKSEQIATLRKTINCLAQMYHISKPMNAAQTTIIKAYHRTVIDIYDIIKNQ
jgi:hypothetical protein